MKNTKFFIICALAGVFMGICIVSYNLWKDNRPPSDIQVGYSPLIINLPLMVAESNGYFEDEGIDVSLVKMSSTNNMRDAISSGKIDICYALGTEMFIKNNNMLPGNLYALFFNVITKNRYQDGLIVRADAEIKSLSCLNDKNIGCYPASTIKIYLETIARKCHITYHQVQVPPTEAFQLLDSGRLDALFAIEPQLSIAKTQPNKYKILEEALLAKHVLEEIPVGVCAINGTFHDSNPKVAAAFVRALNRAKVFIENNPDAAIKIAEKYIDNMNMYKECKLPEWASGDDLNHESFTKFLAFLHYHNIVTANGDHTRYIIKSRKK